MKKMRRLLALALVMAMTFTMLPVLAAAEDVAVETVAPVAEAPAAEKTGQQPAEQPFLVQVTDSDPSIAYVLVTLSYSAGLLPLPLEGEYTKTIRQVLPDGSEYINVLHLTPEGFWMEEANCEGHDCIGEGEVTLSNREERILWNMVICLPHRVREEMITRAEAEQLLGMQP